MVMMEWSDDRINKSWIVQQGNQPFFEEDFRCIWKPFLYMREIHDGRVYKDDVLPVHMTISPETLRVRYYVRYVLQVICRMNFRGFPVDKQKCTLEFTHREYLMRFDTATVINPE